MSLLYALPDNHVLVRTYRGGQLVTHAALTVSTALQALNEWYAAGENPHLAYDAPDEMLILETHEPLDGTVLRYEFQALEGDDGFEDLFTIVFNGKLPDWER